MTDLMPRARGLPKGMPGRMLTLGLYSLGMAFTGFGNAAELATMPAFGWMGFGLAISMYLLWRDRTRPRANGFWILLGIVWGAAAILPIRPYLGIVVALPVALFALHDSPSSPSAMLTWGMVATLSQNPDVWSEADIDAAFYVVLAMVIFIAAAQAERERLAQRHYAPTSKIWMAGRLAVLLVASLLLLGARESLTAINLFTYLGFDLSGDAGKITVMMLMLLALGLTALLFRNRPYKPVDPFVEPKKKVRNVPAQATRPAAAKSTTSKTSGKTSGKPAPKAGRPAPKPAGKPAAKPTDPKGAFKPGEIDFD